MENNTPTKRSNIRNFNTFCIACGKNFKIQGIFYYTLKEHGDVKELLEVICNWPEEINKSHSAKICQPCARQVRSLDKMKKKCEEKEETLRKRFNSVWYSGTSLVDVSPVRFKRVAKYTPEKATPEKVRSGQRKARKKILGDVGTNIPSANKNTDPVTIAEPTPIRSPTMIFSPPLMSPTELLSPSSFLHTPSFYDSSSTSIISAHTSTPRSSKIKVLLSLH